MITVTLIRGPLASKTYEHSNTSGARRRAYALADLHSTSAEQGASGAWTVDASAYYAPRK